MRSNYRTHHGIHRKISKKALQHNKMILRKLFKALYLNHADMCQHLSLSTKYISQVANHI